MKPPEPEGRGAALRKSGGHRISKAGAPPGSLEQADGGSAVKITVLDYGAQNVQEKRIGSMAEAAAFKDNGLTTWIRVTGTGDVATLREFGRLFRVIDLALEDIQNPAHPAKLQHLDENIFLILRVPSRTLPFESEAISMFLGADYVVTFEREPGRFLDPVRERILAQRSRILAGGADYLAYALVDALVDAYFPSLEQYGEVLDRLEDSVMRSLDEAVLFDVYRTRRALISVRRTLWPMREMVHELRHIESDFMREKTLVFLDDTREHVIRLLDLVELNREMAEGLSEVYLSRVNLRLNEVMKLLTIISTIFIPLSFVVGVYGMNFDVMPELRWTWSYPMVLLLLTGIALGFVRYFRRKGWIGRVNRITEVAEVEERGGARAT